MVKGQPSVLEIMRSTGVLSSDEALRFSQITNRMITAQKSIPDDATKPIEGQLISGANAFVDLFARLVGSKIGSALANVIPGRGQGIIESAAGVRTVLGGLNIPTSLTQDLLLQAARDPKFFKLLVTRPKTEKEAVVTAKRVRAYLLNAGLGFVSREIDDDTEEFKKGAPPLPRQFDPDFIPDKQSSVNLPKEGFPTTQTATVPQSGVNARLAANVGTAPQAAPNPNQRQQFASLFPNDPISGLINAQQPPRLMAQGGAAYDMGLETDRAAQETIQSALEGGSDDNQTQTQSFNFRNVPSTISRGIESLMGNIKYTPDVTGVQSFVRDTAGQTAIPYSYQTNIMGFPVSVQPTLPFGAKITATFEEGGAVDEYGQDDDMDYTDVDYGYTSYEDLGDNQDDMTISTNIGKATGGTLVGEIPYDLFNLRDQMNKKKLFRNI